MRERERERDRAVWSEETGGVGCPFRFHPQCVMDGSSRGTPQGYGVCTDGGRGPCGVRPGLLPHKWGRGQTRPAATQTAWLQSNKQGPSYQALTLRPSHLRLRCQPGTALPAHERHQCGEWMTAPPPLPHHAACPTHWPCSALPHPPPPCSCLLHTASASPPLPAPSPLPRSASPPFPLSPPSPLTRRPYLR